MPPLKTYDIFISHAWRYDEDYKKIIEFLEGASNFSYRNYSAPKDKPLFPPGTRVPDSCTEEKIRNKIRPVNIVIVLAGMYYHYHDWIQKEINIASEFSKPIIAIAPWQAKRIPDDLKSDLENAVIETVSWRTDSIVDSIRRNSL